MKTILCILFLICNCVYAQTVDKSTSDGVAVQYGSGSIYGGGIGVSFEYQNIIREKYRITPIVGFGVSLGGTDTSTAVNYWYGNDIGLNFEYGNRNRFLFGPQIKILNNVSNNPETAVPFKKLIIGPSCIAGYKWTSEFGILFQISGGFVYCQNPLLTEKTYFLNPHIGAGAGYKF